MSAKVVVILREPSFRIQSHFKVDTQMGLERRSLEVCLGEENVFGTVMDFTNFWMHIGMSDYMSHIERFARCFAPDQLKIIRFEVLKASPESVISELLDFLGLAVEGVSYEPSEENVGDHPKKLKALDRLLYQTGAKCFLRSASSAFSRDTAFNVLRRCIRARPLIKHK